MKTLLICILFCLISISLASPDKESEIFDLENLELVDLDRGLDFGAILRGLVSSVSNVIGSSLKIANGGGQFILNLNQAISEKIKAGGKITGHLLAKLASHTLNLAVKKEIIREKDADRIRATFDISKPPQIVPVTLTDINKLVIGGDPIQADDFKSDLKELIEAKNNGAKWVNILAGLECHLADLLAANSVIQPKGALDLKAYFNLPNLVRTIRTPVKAIAGVVNFVINLQGKIVGATKYVRSFLSNIRILLEVKAKQIGEFSTTVLTEVLRNTLFNLAIGNGVMNADTCAQLLGTFAGPQSLPFGTQFIPLISPDEVGNLTIGRNIQAAMELRTTLRSLLELQQAGTPKPIILGALQVAVMANLAANEIVPKATVAVPLLTKLGLTPLAELISSATKLITGVQHGVAGNTRIAAMFVTNVKGFVQEKLRTGGQLTMDILGKALRTVLNLAAKDAVIPEHTGHRLAASFGIKLSDDVTPLQLEEIDSLMIGGNNTVANEFRTTVKGLLTIASNGEPESMVSTLAGLNVAIVDLLASNNIIMATAALGLKEFFVTENTFSVNNWKNDEIGI